MISVGTSLRFQNIKRPLSYNMDVEEGPCASVEKGKSLGEWKMNSTRGERKPPNSDF